MGRRPTSSVLMAGFCATHNRQSTRGRCKPDTRTARLRRTDVVDVRQHRGDDVDLHASRKGTEMTAIGWEDVACNLCGSRRSRHLFTLRDYRFLTDQVDFNVVRCMTCSLVRVDPRPLESDIHRYYHDDFYRGQEDAEEALRFMEPRSMAMAEHVNRYPRGRLLDIGCFRGEFIEHMRAEHGWEVKGVEFSDRPPNHFGLDIFYGDIADAPYPDGTFDVITLWAVLEHVYDPSRMLAQAERFLKPGGVI